MSQFGQLFLILMIFGNVGCAKFFSDIRKDFDDPDASPESVDRPAPESSTSGGNWSERGFLDKPINPASKGAQADPSPANSLGEPSAAPSSDVAEKPSLSSGNTPTLEPDKKRQYRRGNRATRDDFVDQSQEEGSLWASSGQTNYYFTKNRIRSPGDIITLNIENDLYRDIGLEVKKTLSPKELDQEIEAAQEVLHKKFFADVESGQKDGVASSAAAPDRNASSAIPNSNAAANAAAPGSTPAASNSGLTPEQRARLEQMVPRATLADVDIYPSLQLKAGDTMMGEILERFPNGNYKIRTLKRVQYKKGPPRIVSLVGVVKASDINEETDVVNSGKLYEYRTEVSR